MGERQRSRRVEGKKRETSEKEYLAEMEVGWDGNEKGRDGAERGNRLCTRGAEGDGRIPTFEFPQYAPLWLPTSIFISPPDAHVKENYPYLAQMARS
jgi:hypothetical protein